jgi:hypothetical protein
MNITVRQEAVGITLADVMIAVAGVAAGFVVEPVRAETSRVVQVCGFFLPVSTYTSLYWTLARFALPVALGLVLVVIVRSARWGRMPRAGEWLGVVTWLLLLDPAVPGAIHVVGPVTTRPMDYHQSPSGAWVPGRHVRPAVLCDLDPEGPALVVLPIAAALAAVAIAAGWVVLRFVRRGLVPWVGVLVLMALAWTWLRVPVRLNSTEVVRFRYSWLAFTPVPSPTGLSRPALDWYVEGRYALGRWPVGLLAMVAALTTARVLMPGRGRPGHPRRYWTEWAGAMLSLVLGGSWAWDELVLRQEPAFEVRATVLAVWLAALAVPAWLIASRLVPRGGSVGCVKRTDPDAPGPQEDRCASRTLRVRPEQGPSRTAS